MASLRHLRSLLFAPAVRPDMFAKLPQRGADAVILDLEDAVPPAAKAEARQAVREHSPSLLDNGCTLFVRINGTDTPWFSADLAEAVVPGVGVLVPKVETMAGLEEIVAALDSSGHGDAVVVAGLETALGVVDARAMLSHPRVSGAYFGAEDFIADMGGRRSDGNAEVAHARSAVALAGRVAGVVVFDQVVTRYDDDERFLFEATEARNMGYAGKFCIHPRQVELANQAFAPSPGDVARARRLLEAYEQGVADGLAAIGFEGQMVDEPLATQARDVLETARRHGIIGVPGEVPGVRS